MPKETYLPGLNAMDVWKREPNTIYAKKYGKATGKAIVNGDIILSIEISTSNGISWNNTWEDTNGKKFKISTLNKYNAISVDDESTLAGSMGAIGGATRGPSPEAAIQNNNTKLPNKLLSGFVVVIVSVAAIYGGIAIYEILKRK